MIFGFRISEFATSMQSDFVEFFLLETSSQKSKFESGSPLADFMLGGMCLKPCGSNDSVKNCNFSKLYLLGSKNVESQIPKFIGLDSDIFSLGESWGDFSWQLFVLRFCELSSAKNGKRGVILGIFLASAHRIQENRKLRVSQHVPTQAPLRKTPAV